MYCRPATDRAVNCPPSAPPPWSAAALLTARCCVLHPAEYMASWAHLLASHSCRQQRSDQAISSDLSGCLVGAAALTVLLLQKTLEGELPPGGRAGSSWEPSCGRSRHHSLRLSTCGSCAMRAASWAHMRCLDLRIPSHPAAAATALLAAPQIVHLLALAALARWRRLFYARWRGMLYLGSTLHVAVNARLLGAPHSAVWLLAVVA